MNKDMIFGIVDFEVALPERKMKLPNDLAKKIKVYEKPIASSLNELLEIALLSIDTVLERSGIMKSQVKNLLVGGTGVFEKSKWSVASRLQHLSGLNQARIIDFQNGCLSALTGAKIAKGLSIDDLDGYTILICLDQYSRVIDPYDPIQWSIASYSDSVGVYLYGSKDVKYGLMDMDWNTIGKFSELDYLDPKTQKMVIVDDANLESELGMEYRKNYTKWIKQITERNDIELDNIHSIYMNQGDHHLIGYLNDAFDFQNSKILRTHELNGHLGANDCFYGVQFRERTDSIPVGSHFLTSASSYGFSWGIAIWRKC